LNFIHLVNSFNSKLTLFDLIDLGNTKKTIINIAKQEEMKTGKNKAAFSGDIKFLLLFVELIMLQI